MHRHMVVRGAMRGEVTGRPVRGGQADQQFFGATPDRGDWSLSLPCPRRGWGLEGAELDQHAEVVSDRPVFLDLAAVHAKHVHLADLKVAPGRGDTEESALVGAAHPRLDPDVIVLSEGPKHSPGDIGE